MTKHDIEVPTTTVDPTDLVAIETAFRDGAQIRLAQGDSEALRGQINDRLLDTQSLDELLATFASPTPAELVLGRALAVRNVYLLPSDEAYADDGRLGIYAVIDAVEVETGEVMRVSCGGQSVVMALVHLARLVREGKVTKDPVLCIVRSERPTRAGYYPLNLAKPIAGEF